VDLAGTLNTAMNAKGGLTGHEDWYTVNLPASAFTELATGSATFALALQNGLGVLGPTDFNAGGIDYSTLTIRTIPEPRTWFILLLGAASGFVARRFACHAAGRGTSKRRVAARVLRPYIAGGRVLGAGHGSTSDRM